MNLRASQFARYAACPGSVKAEEHLPESAPSPDAERGTKIHAWLAAKASEQWPEVMRLVPPVLIEEDEDTAWHLWEKAALKPMQPCRLFIETQLFGFQGDVTGHPDLIYWNDDHTVLHIDDFKTGFWTRRNSEDNAQLRVYAVLAFNEFDNHRPKFIEVRLITPDKRPNAPTVYSQADLLAAEKELAEIVAECKNPLAFRFPGGHCRYCKACGHPQRCPESANLPAEVAQLLPALSVEQAVQALPAENLVRLWMQKKPVKRVFDLIDAEIKARLERDEASIPELKLRSTGSTRQVTDVLEAYKRMTEIPEEAFWKACKVSLADLADEVRQALGCKKKEADEKVRQALEGLIVEKEKSPTIEEA